MRPPLFVFRARAILTLLLCTSTVAFAQGAGPYRPLSWLEMLPPEDLEILFNPPAIDHLGSEEGPGALLRNNRAKVPDPTADDPLSRFEAAMSSVKVMPELDKRPIRLAGFVVPLEYDEKERVTQFFLVPYFGACIHTPPPPPNQIVYVSYPTGLELSSIFDPFFIEGTLRTTLVENDMATAAYSVAADHVLPYSEEEGGE